jgi:hypothetical protein
MVPRGNIAAMRDVRNIPKQGREDFVLVIGMHLGTQMIAATTIWFNKQLVCKTDELACKFL